MLKLRCTPAEMGWGGDTCARVPWLLLKCSSTAASGASRWHCTAVCLLHAVESHSACLSAWSHCCVLWAVWMPPSPLMVHLFCYICFSHPFFLRRKWLLPQSGALKKIKHCFVGIFTLISSKFLLFFCLFSNNA